MMLDTLPPTLSFLTEISDRYDGFLVDQWGVLHDGVNVFPAALDALAAMKRAGKRIVILSNSGRSGEENTALMQAMGISPELYDSVLSAGDDALDALSGTRDSEYEGLGRRMRLYARPDDSVLLLEEGYTTVSDVCEADFLFVLSMPVLSALPKAWLDDLQAARALGLPLICANPDLLRVNGTGQILVAPGALAVHYQSLGGRAFFHGKPWPRIYRTALQRLELPARRVLAVGDSLVHDIAGAEAAGIDSLFVLNGIHRDRIDPNQPGTLLEEFSRYAPNLPTYMIRQLR